MRIGIVNDMPMALQFLRRILADAGIHEVAWEARDGAEAVRRCAADKPDLILMDLVMPVMDGVEATRRIMQESPCAVLVVTASVSGNQSLAFNAITAGALDVIRTPNAGVNGSSDGVGSMLRKIKAIETLVGPAAKRPARPTRRLVEPAGSNGIIIGIGASTGGPAAVVDVLTPLPEDLSAAIVVVLHVDVQFASGMAEWMNALVPLPVRIAEEGERPAPGTVLLAATNDHLVMTRDLNLHYTEEPRDYHYRPSADTFFESLVRHWRGEAVGVLLTGMGKDGAKGLKEMHQKGWHTIAQDEESSVVYGMPKAAAEIGAALEVLPLGRIGAALVRQAGRRTVPKEDEFDS